MAARPSPVPAFELLESKLLLPQGRGGSVRRENLIARVEGSTAIPAVVMSAGPGWGKTMLLAQWASRSKRPFAWVALDEKDNDPVVLLTYVAAALDRISPLDSGVFEALASPGVSVEATVVPRLGAALAAIRQPVVLALDDLHLLDNPACLDAIAALTRHVAQGSQVVLSSRGGPAFPLGKLRVEGTALEIGPDDLRMDEADARQLLDAAGVTLQDEEITELTEHTEGWPAGLYLAALSIRARGHKTEAAAAFSGSDRLVSDYLRSELLGYLSPDDLRFLTRTAVLEMMSGPLCDAVLDETGSTAILASLARSNLFLVPLDTNGESYRYHHLFRELLRNELERAEPEVVPELLTRAATWCEADGQLEAAIPYRQEAGDVDRVARLFEMHGQLVYQSGRVTTVERWLNWLEAQGALERQAAAAVIGALIAAVQGRPAEVERLADLAERADYEGDLPDGSPSIEAWLALLRAMRCRRGVAQMRADAELAVGTLARKSQFHPTAILLLAISHLVVGELDEADDLLADAADEGLALEALEPVAVALSERAAIAIGREDWVQAEEFANRALEVIRRARMREYPTSTLAFAVGARVALHRRETVARERASRERAAPAAEAHIRCTAPGVPGSFGACPCISDARRRRRRQDDVARDRRAIAATAGSRRAAGRG